MEGIWCLQGQFLKKCIVLFGCILIQLTLGSRYSLTNFSPYIISYVRERTDDTTVSNVDVLWIGPAGVIGRCVGVTLGGILDKRFGPRVAVGIGSIVFVSSILLCAPAVKHSYLAFVMSYGGYGSFGMMMCYGVTIQTAIKWLNKRPALASGIVMTGLGASAFVFNQVITQFINPDNLTPNRTDTGETERYFLDDNLLDRVPNCFLLLGGIFGGMMAVGVLCLFDAPTTDKKSQEISENHLHNNIKIKDVEIQTIQASTQIKNSEGKETQINEISSPETEKIGSVSLSTKEAIQLAFKTRSFYILWLTMFCIDSGIHFAIGLNKAYGQTFIEDDHFLALVGSVGSVFNCIMRPVWGLLLDKFGFKISIRLLTFGLALTVGTIVLTEHLHKAFYMVWTAAIYAAFCGTAIVGPSTLTKLFGAQNMAINYGFIMSAVGCAAIIGSVTATSLKEILGWHNMFYMSAAFIIMPFFTTFVFNGKDRDGKWI